MNVKNIHQPWFEQKYRRRYIQSLINSWLNDVISRNPLNFTWSKLSKGFLFFYLKIDKFQKQLIHFYIPNILVVISSKIFVFSNIMFVIYNIDIVITNIMFFISNTMFVISNIMYVISNIIFVISYMMFVILKFLWKVRFFSNKDVIAVCGKYFSTKDLSKYG